MTALDIAAVAPLVFISTGAFVALLLSGFLSRGIPAEGRAAAWDRSSTLSEARIGATLALFCIASLAFTVYTAWAAFSGGAAPMLDPFPALLLDPLSTFAIALIGVEVLLCVLLSIAYLPALHIHHGGYYGLMMTSAAGMMLVVCAGDLVLLFAGVELMIAPLCVLVGLSRRREGAEAALKLMVTSVFASAVMLYGAALLFGATGETSYAGLRPALASGNGIALAGLALVLVALGFKLAAFPFHAWAPDVLHGAPTAVTPMVSVAAVTAAAVVLARLLGFVWGEAELAPSLDRVRMLLRLAAGATMVAGSVMALVQTNAKRMLVHAGVAHVGMLLLGLTCATEQARAAVLFYLVAYAPMALGAFAVLIAMSQRGRDCESFQAFEGLGSRHPVLSAAMALFVLALAGIPGTAGFMAKFHLLLAAVRAGEIELVLVAAFTSVVLLACYLRIPVAMYMRAPSQRGSVAAGTAELFVLALCAAAVLYLGFAPDVDPFGAGFRALEATSHAASLFR